MRKFLLIGFLFLMIFSIPIFAWDSSYQNRTEVNITDNLNVKRNPEIIVFNLTGAQSSCSPMQVYNSTDNGLLNFYANQTGSSCRIFIQANLTAGYSGRVAYLYHTNVTPVSSGSKGQLTQLVLFNETCADGNILDNSTGYNWSGSVNFGGNLDIQCKPDGYFYSMNEGGSPSMILQGGTFWNNVSVLFQINENTTDSNAQGGFMFAWLNETRSAVTGVQIDTYSNVAFRFFARINNAENSLRADVAMNTYQLYNVLMQRGHLDDNITRVFINATNVLNISQQNITGVVNGTIALVNYDPSPTAKDLFFTREISVIPNFWYNTIGASIQLYNTSNVSGPSPPANITPNLQPFPARNIIEDTYVCNNVCSYGVADPTFNKSSGARHGNETYILYDDANTSSTLNTNSLFSYFKISNTLFSRIIKNVTFNFESNNVFDDCFGTWVGNWNFFFLENDTWSENINFTERPTSSVFANLSYKASPLDTFFAADTNYSVILSARRTFGSQYMMNDLYRDSMTSFYTFDNQDCVARTMSSSENWYPPYINVTYDEDNYDEGFSNSLDSISGDLFLDFESGNYSGSGSQTIFYDIFYDNIFNAIRANPNVTIASAHYSTSQENDLAFQIAICPQLTTYSTASIPVNVVNGTYSYVCVNMSSQHRNESFFGMIKMIDNMNIIGGGNIDPYFIWALSGPSYSAFTSPSYLPNPQLAAANLTVITTSSTPLYNTTMYFSITQGSSVGPYTATFNITSETFTHRFLINSQYMVSPAYYQLYFTGVNTLGETVNSSVYNFSIVSSPSSETANTILPSGLEQLGQSVGGTQNALYIFGFLILILGTIIAYLYLGGMNMAITLAVLLTVTLSIMGFLPSYLLYPIIVGIVGIIIIFIRKAIGGENK